MKLGNLLIAGTAAALSYWAVTNKDKITKEIDETTGLIHDISNHYADIQEQLARIQAYRQPLQETLQDLQYKFRVYQQEANSHLAQIQEIQKKYTHTE